MATNMTKLTLALSSAIAASLAGAPVSATDSPFATQTLSKGYMVAAADEKSADKAAEAKCGDMHKDKEGSCGGKKSKEASCGGAKKKHSRDCDSVKKKMKDDKDKEKNCGGNMKMDDKKSDAKPADKASEMKCGAMMKMDDKK